MSLGAGCRGFKSLHSDHLIEGVVHKEPLPQSIHPKAGELKGFEGEHAKM